MKIFHVEVTHVTDEPSTTEFFVLAHTKAAAKEYAKHHMQYNYSTAVKSYKATELFDLAELKDIRFADKAYVERFYKIDSYKHVYLKG